MAQTLDKPTHTATGGTHLSHFGLSEAGKVRTVNQDSFFAGEIPGKGFLALVADGMGGHKTGEVASQKTVEIIVEVLEQSRATLPAALARAVQSANQGILTYAQSNPQHRGMGTTLTMIFIDDQVGLVGHVGDSRAYLVREREIKQLTEDHSWVADRVRQGLLTEDEAERHQWRNVITNALGATSAFKFDISHFKVQAGDRFLLCSDGVSTLLSEQRLHHIVHSQSPEGAVGQLIREANDRGSPDNVTAVVLQVDRLNVRPKRYTLPPAYFEMPGSVQISETMSGIRKVEDAFPRKSFFSWLRRHPLYPYRIWLLGSCYLLFLILVFVFIQR